MERRAVFQEIERSRTEMASALIELVRVPAIAPENGGGGELEKAEKLKDILEAVGFDRIEWFDASDPRVPCGKRPNIVAVCDGKSETKRLWVVTHLDVVPAGVDSLWTVTKPFDPILRDGRIFGRGSEDNGQSLVASVFAAKALKRLKAELKRSLALAFVSDEEQGSIYGIQHLIDKGIFGKEDLVVVPDGGTGDGSFIEIAEKSILWFKVRTLGKQTHGSLPNKGLNAHRIGMQVALALDERLHGKYSAIDPYFDVPVSTFEPTKKEPNVAAVNIVPGEDVAYFDCRVLPRYDLEDVIETVHRVLVEFEKKTGAAITLELLQKQASPKLVNEQFEIVTLLKTALREARGIDARVGGIGGGSCAAFFRKAGIPAVVWSTVDEVAHQHNEYCKLENMVADAEIFALMALI